MLLAALLIAVSTAAHAQELNITYFKVPGFVDVVEDFAVFECGYDPDFTTFSFRRSNMEFLRFSPSDTPSIRVWHPFGVESIDVLSCGPTACSVKLGGMSEDASGVYTCELENELPPYKHVRKEELMMVHRNEPMKPIVEGLVEEYDEGETLHARCLTEPDSKVLWYVNGVEAMELRNAMYFKKKMNVRYILRIPRTLSVQCALSKYGRKYFSQPQTTRFREDIIIVNNKTTTKQIPMNKTPTKQEMLACPPTNCLVQKQIKAIVLCSKGSPTITGCLELLSISFYLLAKVIYI